jgi:hypothetical protein
MRNSWPRRRPDEGRVLSQSRSAKDVQDHLLAVLSSHLAEEESMPKVFEDHLNEPQDSDLSVPASHDRTLARRSEASKPKTSTNVDENEEDR